MTSPLVSIGVPTYNRPSSLEKTIKSLIQQDYSNIEIIISNNASTDTDVENVINKYKNTDCRIKPFHQKTNIGMTENFKFVLSKAKGEYFFWAPDDDSFSSSFISRCLFFLKNNDNNVLCCTDVNTLIDGKKANIRKRSHDLSGLNKIDRIILTAINTNTNCYPILGLIKTKFLKKCSIENYLGADALLLIQLSIYGNFFQINESLITYNYHTSSSSNLSSNKKKYLKSNGIKPVWFILKYESLARFLFFSTKSIQWTGLNLLEKIKLIKTYYLVNILPNSVFINKFLIFSDFFKKKKIIKYYLDTNKFELTTDLKEDKIFMKWYSNSFISFSTSQLNDIFSCSKTIFNKFSHIQLVESNKITNKKHDNYAYKILSNRKNFNSHITIHGNNKTIHILPLRPYVKLDENLNSNIKNLEINI